MAHADVLIRTMFAASVSLVFLASPVSMAHAQSSPQAARYGNKFTIAGVSTQPGLLSDPRAPTFPGFDGAARTQGALARMGLIQFLSAQLSMSAEVDLGLVWLNEHTANTIREADSEFAFALQVGVVARWLPTGDLRGPSLGLGSHLFRAGLEDVPLTILAAEPRLGWLFWGADDAFGMVEIGWALPLSSGLHVPTTLGTADEARAPEPVVQQWRWQRPTVNLIVGF
ncbi:MAG: hypothetical protein AAGI01_13545 [Myxococcota bacterium]